MLIINFSISFILKIKYGKLFYSYYISFLHLSSNGHVGYFHIVAIMTSASMITTVNLLCVLISLSLYIDTIGGLLGYAVIQFF